MGAIPEVFFWSQRDPGLYSGWRSLAVAMELTARPLSVVAAMREMRDPVSVMAQKLLMLLAVEVG